MLRICPLAAGMTFWRQMLPCSRVCLGASILLGSQNLVVPQANSPVSQEPGYAVSVDVDLVNVTATVVDEFGRYIDDLSSEDFRVFENGQEQKISFFSHYSQIPISIGVLMDISGSHQDKLRQGLQIVREIVASLSNHDEMFVITFNSHVEVKQRFTNNSEEIQRSLGEIRAHGETAVYDAISAGLQEMHSAQQQKRILLLVSDGFDTKSRISPTQAEELLKSSNVLLYVIGIDDDDNDPSTRRRTRYHIYNYMLAKLASAGNGRVIRLYTGKNYDLHILSELFLGELHQEYTMGYYTQTPTDVGTRNIEVHVEKPGARILGERTEPPRPENPQIKRP